MENWINGNPMKVGHHMGDDWDLRVFSQDISEAVDA